VPNSPFKGGQLSSKHILASLSLDYETS
jgi:hypothetical protein